MTTEQFTYWLNGFFEISSEKTLNEKQVLIIKDHLDLVFNKVTPDRSKELSLEKFLPGLEDELLLANNVIKKNVQLKRKSPTVYC